MWLCIKCLQVHAWKKTCASKSHPAEIIAGPLNEASCANFLIHGTAKPLASSNLSEESTPTNAAIDLTVDLLNLIFQKQVRTIASIPHQCRLQFSRTPKSALDKVILQPANLHAWLQLLLLPICILNIYIPKCSTEERSSNRKRLQVAAINQAIQTWNEPNGCSRMIQNFLSQQKPPPKQPNKKQKKKEDPNLEAYKRKIAKGHFSAAVCIISSNALLNRHQTLYSN